MTETALTRFVAAVRADWGPISSELVARCRGHLDDLSLASEGEEWLAALLAERPATRELHREADSFMLLAHAEKLGLYRPPHDHGRAWVVYGVQSGALEICTYARVSDANSDHLVRRDTTLLKPGQARAYLPGDIHDTRCATDDAMVFRFTERDLRHEDQVERKVMRFVERDGAWRVPLS
ncbi:hypothetical protein [Sphingomonas soli]|uniref:hypothetical protein n=1 Tax=Sphingomonas soli TaxID=266127 RepID=UPI000A455972|nr:hypothetical protein [Sphingomonas soli]